MSRSRLIAATAVIGATVIALADMPDWTVDPFIGWVAATAGVAMIGQFAPDVATGMAGLMLAALVLSRGRDAVENINRMIPGRR